MEQASGSWTAACNGERSREGFILRGWSVLLNGNAVIRPVRRISDQLALVFRRHYGEARNGA